jgi:hypothetical protein
LSCQIQTNCLVQNTDFERIITDFPHYTHGLHQLLARFQHLLQFGKTETQLQPSAQVFMKKIQHFLEHMSGKVWTTEAMLSVPTLIAQAALSHHPQ